MITFVYFDVGGVAIKDFSASGKWNELKSALGVTPAKEQQFTTIWNRHIDHVCIDYDVDQMVAELNAELELAIPPSTSLIHEFVKRFEKNESLWPVIQHIQTTTRVGLLTDMYPRLLDAIQKAQLLPPIQWDTVLDSSVEKLQKPDVRLFARAEARAGVRGKAILFVENRKQLCDAADAYGWTTFYYDSADYVGSSAKLHKFFDHIRLG